MWHLFMLTATSSFPNKRRPSSWISPGWGFPEISTFMPVLGMGSSQMLEPKSRASCSSMVLGSFRWHVAPGTESIPRMKLWRSLPGLVQSI